MSRLLGSLVAVGLAGICASPALAKGRQPLDNRAPDLVTPRALTMPAGVSEIDFGLGALIGPSAPLQPVTPIPQLFWVHGFSDRIDLTAGLFGGGGSAFLRYGLLPGSLNLEVGVQAVAIPSFVVEPLAELQWDLPVGSAIVHLVPGVQPLLGATPSLSFFGVAGVEMPLAPDWRASASLKAIYTPGLPLDLGPSIGVRKNLSEQWGVEAIALVQAGAPATLLLAGYRFGGQ